MNRFVDTSGWAEWSVQGLRFHTQALAVVQEVANQAGRLLTTNLILVELTGLLTSPLHVPKSRQIQLVDDLCNDPLVELIAIDSVLEAAAWQLWRNRPDKNWSLVDCSSFLVMQRRGLTEAITTDHHFEQAGFVRLLK